MSAIDYSITDIEKVVQGIDGQIRRVDISRLTAPGENYLSLVFRVDFEVEKDGRTQTVSTVAKRLPFKQDEKIDFTAIGMRNEIKFYSELLPIIRKANEEFGLDSDYYAEYMGSRLSLDSTKDKADAESILLLRNLIPEGYKNVDRHVGFDLLTIKTVLKKLAVFHAIPLLIKFKKPDLFKTIKDFLEHYAKMDDPPPGPPPKDDGSPHDGPPMDGIFEQMLKIPACQPYLDKIEILKNKSSGPMIWGKEGPEPWNTIIHIDYWVNNIMIKFREEAEPLVKMVDFQFYSYCSFAKDVVFLLLTSVKSDVQKQRFDELLKYYYNQLTNILNDANVPQLKLSYEEYLAELKRVALESEVSHAIFFTTVIFGDKEAVPDFLMGEGDMMEHIEHMHNNMAERQKEKLATILELAVAREWL